MELEMNHFKWSVLAARVLLVPGLVCLVIAIWKALQILIAVLHSQVEKLACQEHAMAGHEPVAT
jgi:hypothetical protein